MRKSAVSGFLALVALAACGPSPQPSPSTEAAFPPHLYVENRGGPTFVIEIGVEPFRRSPAIRETRSRQAETSRPFRGTSRSSESVTT